MTAILWRSFCKKPTYGVMLAKRHSIGLHTKEEMDMNFKKVLNIALLILAVAVFTGCVANGSVEPNDDLGADSMANDSAIELVTNADVVEPDGEAQHQDYMAKNDESVNPNSDSEAQPHGFSLISEPFKSEAEFKEVLLSKDCPDDLIRYRAGYYVPKSLPTGYTLAYIKARNYSIGLYYHNEEYDGSEDVGEFRFAWEVALDPKYLESDLKNSTVPYERYKDLYLKRFSKTMSVHWIQGDMQFYAAMPIDTPLEVVEDFCDAVYISLKP